MRVGRILAKVTGILVVVSCVRLALGHDDPIYLEPIMKELSSIKVFVSAYGDHLQNIVDLADTWHLDSYSWYDILNDNFLVDIANYIWTGVVSMVALFVDVCRIIIGLFRFLSVLLGFNLSGT